MRNNSCRQQELMRSLRRPHPPPSAPKASGSLEVNAIGLVEDKRVSRFLVVSGGVDVHDDFIPHTSLSHIPALQIRLRALVLSHKY